MTMPMQKPNGADQWYDSQNHRQSDVHQNYNGCAQSPPQTVMHQTAEI